MDGEISILTIKDLPSEDRPREKLKKLGGGSLTDAELIAIILRTGKKGKSVLTIAHELVHKHVNLAGLVSLSLAELKKISGIGEDKAISLLAAFEIGRRMQSQSKWSIDKKITSPKDIAEFFVPILRDELKEKFIVVCLNSANKVTKFEAISVGSLNSSVVHPREIFKFAIENSSASIILVHNHPSGNLEPSNEDIAITKKMVEAGKILNIEVLDHIIVGGNSFTSLVERRLM
ncbi:MAG TPA: DNA repair protein RadC [Ignavibacteriaceae bacterium]